MFMFKYPKMHSNSNVNTPLSAVKANSPRIFTAVETLETLGNCLI